MKIMIAGLLLLSCQLVRAQTFDEWFRQKATQLKYLRQQIAALQLYEQVTSKGYALVKEAVQGIAVIKTGDINLHSGYFSSLRMVKPGIGQQALDIANIQERIIVIVQGMRGKFVAGDLFFSGLLEACKGDMDLLKVLTTDGGAQLRDDQRLAAIAAVQMRMEQRLRDAVTARNVILEMQLNGGL